MTITMLMRDRRRCLDHGHRAALLPLLIAVVDRRLIPSGATNDTKYNRTHEQRSTNRTKQPPEKLIFTILLQRLLLTVVAKNINL